MIVLVHSMTLAGEGVMLIELRATDTPLPQWQPGAHIDVHLGAMIRQYSLIGGSADSWLIAVRLDDHGRGGSRAIHEQVRPGHLLEVGGPRNNFPLHPGRAVLMAGGIGVTPLIPMMGPDSVLHVYSRSPEVAPLYEYLNGFPVTWHSDGLRHADHLPADYRPGSHLYVCGPDGFMNKVRELAKADGWPESAIHQEKFRSDPPVTSGSEFNVTIASTGETMPVHDGQTIAEVLHDHGFDVPLSCEIGICGSCLTGVIDGVPDHRDDIQSPAQHAAGTLINVCCSRSKTPELTLDL